MRILVTGASGLLGLNFSLRFSDEHSIIGIVNSHLFHEVPFSVQPVDLSIEKNVHGLINQYKPDVLINCAAIADVDKCEEDPQGAELLNAELPGWLAEVCARSSVQLVHLSTDAVFDGTKEGKYTEEDIPNPLGVYAHSKLMGEKAVQQVDRTAVIARVNFYGFSLSGTRSLAEVFLHNLQNRKEMFGFTDILFSPLYVLDLAEIIMKIVTKELSGLYHVTSPESQSKYDFGLSIAQKFKLDESLIQPISVNDANFLSARRSKNLMLDPQKASQALGMDFPAQQEGLERFYQSYLAGFAQRIYTLREGV